MFRDLVVVAQGFGGSLEKARAPPGMPWKGSGKLQGALLEIFGPLGRLLGNNGGPWREPGGVLEGS